VAKAVVTVGWAETPHLTDEVKEAMLKSIPPFQRDARTKGIPILGAGAIYPVSEDDYIVDDFPIPDHWPRAYALDVGWNKTAAVWGAWDRDTDVVYEYSEHYMGEAPPLVHADAIKGRGAWIPGVIDPAARGRTQTDGSNLMDIYREHGLDILKAENAVEAGIYAVWQRLMSGKLKTFRSCRNIIAERRIYRRDEKGKVVKAFDHGMDSERYLIVSGLARACVAPVEEDDQRFAQAGGWMGR
jgi:hypothetical protein